MDLYNTEPFIRPTGPATKTYGLHDTASSATALQPFSTDTTKH